MSALDLLGLTTGAGLIVALALLVVLVAASRRS